MARFNIEIKEMEDIDDLRRETSYSLTEFPTWASIVILMSFLVATWMNDLKAMILSVFGLSTVGLASAILKQRKINKILLEEIDRLRNSNAKDES